MKITKLHSGAPVVEMILQKKVLRGAGVRTTVTPKIYVT